VVVVVAGVVVDPSAQLGSIQRGPLGCRSAKAKEIEILVLRHELVDDCQFPTRCSS
jgi:hypothetical protein